MAHSGLEQAIFGSTSFNSPNGAIPDDMGSGIDILLILYSAVFTCNVLRDCVMCVNKNNINNMFEGVKVNVIMYFSQFHNCRCFYFLLVENNIYTNNATTLQRGDLNSGK